MRRRGRSGPPKGAGLVSEGPLVAATEASGAVATQAPAALPTIITIVIITEALDGAAMRVLHAPGSGARARRARCGHRAGRAEGCDSQAAITRDRMSTVRAASHADRKPAMRLAKGGLKNFEPHMSTAHANPRAQERASTDNATSFFSRARADDHTLCHAVRRPRSPEHGRQETD